MLRFPNSWRFQPPEDGRFANKELPAGAVDELIALASKVATQGSRWGILEHFKAHTAAAAGETHSRSSSEDWSVSDMARNFAEGAANAPVLIEAFFDACAALAKRQPDWWLPDEQFLNEVLRRHNVGYRVSGQDLVALEDSPSPVPVPEAPPPSVPELAVAAYQDSMQRAEQLLQEGRAREAVQESLWLLETIATAFRGLETESGAIAGKYFNQIARELRSAHTGGALDRALDWATSLHGYLSSPSGGGVRHGLDLNAGVGVSLNEARLYCNLIRSYIGYLLGEHERLSARRS